MMPRTIRPLGVTRVHLSAVVAGVRQSPGRVWAFGVQSRPEAVMVGWGLYTELVTAALLADDAAHTPAIVWHLRNAAGTSPLPARQAAELLEVPAGPDWPAPLAAWPGAFDDLLRLTDAQPEPVRAAALRALTAAATRVGGRAMASPAPPGLHRHVVATGAGHPAVAAAVRLAGAGGDGQVELVAVGPAGSLLTRLLDPGTELGDVTDPAADP